MGNSYKKLNPNQLSKVLKNKTAQLIYARQTRDELRIRNVLNDIITVEAEIAAREKVKPTTVFEA